MRVFQCTETEVKIKYVFRPIDWEIEMQLFLVVDSKQEPVDFLL